MPRKRAEEGQLRQHLVKLLVADIRIGIAVDLDLRFRALHIGYHDGLPHRQAAGVGKLVYVSKLARRYAEVLCDRIQGISPANNKNSHTITSVYGMRIYDHMCLPFSFASVSSSPS